MFSNSGNFFFLNRHNSLIFHFFFEIFLHILKAEKILNKMIGIEINQEKQNIIIMYAQVYSCILEADCMCIISS
jgi:hypothetical protein